MLAHGMLAHGMLTALGGDSIIDEISDEL